MEVCIFGYSVYLWGAFCLFEHLHQPNNSNPGSINNVSVFLFGKQQLCLFKNTQFFFNSGTRRADIIHFNFKGAIFYTFVVVCSIFPLIISRSLELKTFNLFTVQVIKFTIQFSTLFFRLTFTKTYLLWKKINKNRCFLVG